MIERWSLKGSSPGNISQENHYSKDTSTLTFIAALLTVAKTWKQPKCPPADEWIKKIWHTYTMEYYSASKRNKTGSFVGTWMDLKGHKAWGMADVT